MFNSVAIEVFTGLIAVYLLYSLLASIIMEVIAKYLALRARITLKAIAKLLDDSEFTNDGYLNRVLHSAKNGKFFDQFKGRDFTALFYAHPNIKNLGRNNFERKPADISPEMFAITLIQLLRGDNFKEGVNTIKYLKDNVLTTTQAKVPLPAWYNSSKNSLKINSLKVAIAINPLTEYQLKQMMMDSGEDIDLFKKFLQSWFNVMMDRANGWYTKQTRGILFLVGFVVAITFNIDTIAIAQRLSTDKSARDGMIEFAAKLNDTRPKPGDSTSAQKAAEKAFKVANENMDQQKLIFSSGDRDFCRNGFGWFISALAISLGAPFWFDLLGKFMTIAQVGKTSSTNNKDKDKDEPVG